MSVGLIFEKPGIVGYPPKYGRKTVVSCFNGNKLDSFIKEEGREGGSDGGRYGVGSLIVAGG